MPILLAACLSLIEIRHAECRVYCSMNGYDGGYYAEQRAACYCVDAIPHERTKVKRIKVPLRRAGSPPVSAGGGVSAETAEPFDIAPYLDLQLGPVYQTNKG